MSEIVPVVSGSRAASRQVWSERLDRFASARLSVVAFCKSEGISLQSFYYWKRKLAKDPALSDPDAPRLLPVHVLPSANPIELVLPHGLVLRLTPGCDLAFIRSLVFALGGSPC